MQWIKAKDRLPEPNTNKYIKIPSLETGDYIMGVGFYNDFRDEANTKGWLFTSGIPIEERKYNLIEWLDDSESEASIGALPEMIITELKTEPAIMQSAFQFPNGKRMICYTSYALGIKSFECDENWKPYAKPFGDCPFEWSGKKTMTEYHQVMRAKHDPENFVKERSTPLPPMLNGVLNPERSVAENVASSNSDGNQKRLSPEEILDKHYNQNLGFLSITYEQVIAAMQEYASQFKGQDLSEEILKDSELFYYRNILNPYSNESPSYTGYKKGFTEAWQFIAEHFKGQDLPKECWIEISANEYYNSDEARFFNHNDKFIYVKKIKLWTSTADYTLP